MESSSRRPLQLTVHSVHNISAVNVTTPLRTFHNAQYILHCIALQNPRQRYGTALLERGRQGVGGGTVPQNRGTQAQFRF